MEEALGGLVHSQTAARKVRETSLTLGLAQRAIHRFSRKLEALIQWVHPVCFPLAADRPGISPQTTVHTTQTFPDRKVVNKKSQNYSKCNPGGIEQRLGILNPLILE